MAKKGVEMRFVHFVASAWLGIGTAYLTVPDPNESLRTAGGILLGIGAMVLAFILGAAAIYYIEEKKRIARKIRKNKSNDDL